MLLLVLILVVIAFGLLVVALLTGSVLWAWVSVGVSVVAAVVLLVDWLQRRSAVKAGAVAPVSPPPARPAPAVDLDPATEILPVVPASERRSSGSDGPSGDRTERVQDTQQTVAMPVVQPSGSSSRPPGAEATVTSSGGISSPSVTNSEGEPSPSTESGEGADDVTRTTSGTPGVASGDTVSISKDSLPRNSFSAGEGAQGATRADQAPAASETRSSDAAGPDAGGPSGSRPSLSKDDRPTPADGDGAAVDREPAAPSSTADMTEVVRLDRTGERGDAGPDESTSVVRRSAPADATPSGSEQTVVTSLAAVTGSRPDPSAEAPRSPAEETGGATADTADARAQEPTGREPTGREPTARESTNDVEKTVKVEARTPKNQSGDEGASASTPPPTQPPPPVPEPPGDEGSPADPTVVVQSPPAEQAAGRPTTRNDVDLFAPAAEPDAVDVPPSEQPSGPLGEAPEEQSDPIAAEIVSGLDDEVLVVDEQPRYHVATCRALVSTAVIPLPVREAVELGFTPCGWCSPERTLAGHHRTAAH